MAEESADEIETVQKTWDDTSIEADIIEKNDEREVDSSQLEKRDSQPVVEASDHDPKQEVTALIPTSSSSVVVEAGEHEAPVLTSGSNPEITDQASTAPGPSPEAMDQDSKLESPVSTPSGPNPEATDQEPKVESPSSTFSGPNPEATDQDSKIETPASMPPRPNLDQDSKPEPPAPSLASVTEASDQESKSEVTEVGDQKFKEITEASDQASQPEVTEASDQESKEITEASDQESKPEASDQESKEITEASDQASKAEVTEASDQASKAEVTEASNQESKPEASDQESKEITEAIDQVSKPEVTEASDQESKPASALNSAAIEASDQDSKLAGSQIEVASPNDACKAGQKQCLSHPLSLNWSFGFNNKLPVHNISEGNRKMVFYVCAHTGVLFDCAKNQQCLLQGHSNTISCTAVSGDRRWLVTADNGKDSILIVWDSFSGVPVRTIFDGLGEGVVAVAISSDSQFLATITATKLELEQVISIWEWTVESETPICQVALGEDYNSQKHLIFKQDDPHLLVSNSEDLVVFYHWHQDNGIKFHAHPVLDKDFNKTIGMYSQSVFLSGSSQMALTGTSEGHCIVWETEGENEPHLKKGVKLMKMHDDPITVVTFTIDMVVTGDTQGKIKFFDCELKLLNWYEDTMKYGPLCSISFSYSPEVSVLRSELAIGKSIPETLGERSYQPESTKMASPFIIPDFIISTTYARVAYIAADSTIAETVLNEHDGAINALATHPFLHYLLVGSYTCKIKLWDYDLKIVVSSREFGEPNYIQCLCFDPKGEFIGIGFTDGTLQVVDAITLDDVCPSFHYSRDAVTHVSFSHDSAFMATADLDKCVSVYVAQSTDPHEPWKFLAKYRSHYKKIEGLLFGIHLDSDAPRLLSLGRDRTLVEYDLANSSSEDLCLLSIDRIEQSAVPLALTWYPPLTTESFILHVNSQYKIKLSNSTTKMCRKTLLGPTFGSPLKKVMVLPRADARKYLVYSTNNKVGLLLLPHDGNPHNSKCLVAHPGMVTDMTCSFDGKYIFTAGGEDYTVNMWNINTDALEAAFLLGGEDLQPFYAMLEGGRGGEFFKELEEYFYYSQICSQGSDVTSTRKVSTTIPIDQIPYIMRAIGFYPSEQEIEDMLNEVKFSKYVDTGAYVLDIDLEDFIRLYINHRPVFGLSPLQIGHAFKVLGEKLGDEKYWSVYRSKLLTSLQEKGEHLTETELVEYLMTLMGYSDNPEMDGSFTQDAIAALKEIPDRISAPMFAEEIIGLSAQ